MDYQKQSETHSVSQSSTESQPQTDPVKLVEMGDVSVETKGTVRGLELGLTPRY